MSKVIKYAIFSTEWGYFGLAGSDSALLRTQLPAPDRQKIKAQLTKNLPEPEYDENLFPSLQKQITAYYQGCNVNFDPSIPLYPDTLTPFARRVLTACRAVPFGQTVSYGQLAKKIRRPAAARAIGRVMARNPLPLIVPCHRVTAAAGKIGGFSAPGGVPLKKRMLKLEQNALPKKR